MRKLRGSSEKLGKMYADKRKDAGKRKFDGYLKKDFKVFRPQEGDNTIRIINPTWEDPEHFGYIIWAHEYIGVSGSYYLCSKKMSNKPCPLCDELSQVEGPENKKLWLQIGARLKYLVWLIDRNNEDQGPQLWALPKTVEEEIFIQSGRAGYVEVDHVDEGHDVTFSYTPKKGNSPGGYKAIQLLMNPSSLSDNDDSYEEWLDFVEDNPIPDVLIHHDYETIRKGYYGEISEGQEQEEETVESNQDETPREKLRKLRGRS